MNLDDYLNEYFERFGRNYPICVVGLLSTEEIIAGIKKCLETNTEAEPLTFDDDLDY